VELGVCSIDAVQTACVRMCKIVDARSIQIESVYSSAVAIIELRFSCICSGKSFLNRPKCKQKQNATQDEEINISRYKLCI
jgi:hypothetical protein